MRVITARRTFRFGDEFTLWPLSDFHLGALDCDEAAIRRDVARIADDPYAIALYMGDVGDLIDHRDKRHHPGMLSERYRDAMFAEGGIPTETVAHATELLLPIKDKLVAVLSGNHERTIRNRYDREIGSELAANLGTEYLGYGGFVRLTFTRQAEKNASEAAKNAYARTMYTVIIDAAHGWQAGRRRGAKVNQLELELGETNADIILRGHSHDRFADRFDTTKVSNTAARPWTRIVAHCGTYKIGRVEDKLPGGETHDTWEATRGFRRKHTLGPPLIHIKMLGRGGSRPTDSEWFEYRLTS